MQTALVSVGFNDKFYKTRVLFDALELMSLKTSQKC